MIKVKIEIPDSSLISITILFSFPSFLIQVLVEKIKIDKCLDNYEDPGYLIIKEIKHIYDDLTWNFKIAVSRGNAIFLTFPKNVIRKEDILRTQWEAQRIS